MGRTPRYDWSAVDWTQTNEQITALLGGKISRETVARKRVALGHPTVYPPSPREVLARVEVERDEAVGLLRQVAAALGQPDQPLADLPGSGEALRLQRDRLQAERESIGVQP